MINIKDFAQKAEKEKQSHKQLVDRLKRKPLPKLDLVFQELHDHAFEKIDCLECANCCRTLGPRLGDRDIDRLAKALRMKPSEFVQLYLRIDEDRDYVFKNMPCPFLGTDNYCSVYDDRPKACKEYPHTDSKKMAQLLNLTLKNTSTCPAVFDIMEELKKL